MEDSVNDSIEVDLYGRIATSYGGVQLYADPTYFEDKHWWDSNLFWVHDGYILIRTKVLNGSFVGMRVRYSHTEPAAADLDSWHDIEECAYDPIVPPVFGIMVGSAWDEPPLNDLQIPPGKKRIRVSRRLQKGDSQRNLRRPDIEDRAVEDRLEQILLEIWDDTGTGDEPIHTVIKTTASSDLPD